MTAQVSQPHLQILIKAGELFTSGRFQEAIKACLSVLQEAPDNADALHIQGLSQLNLGDPEAAQNTLKKAVKARKSDAGIANSLALAHLANGNADSAAATLEKLARKGKLTPEGLTTLGDCRLRQAQPAKALACFERALKAKPDLPAALVNKGEALKESGRVDDAINHYLDVTQRFPELTSAWRNLGLLLQDLHRLSESIAALETFVKARPQDTLGLKALGKSYLLHQESDHALATFEAAIKVDPADAEAWNNRGLSLRALDRLDEAKNAFSEALRLNSELGAARLNVAHLVRETDGVDPALTLLGSEIEHRPDDPKPHMDRAQILLEEGRIAESWDDYQWRYKTPPDFAGYRDHTYPQWTGESGIEGELLIWGEQGIGDEILHASLIHEAMAVVPRVVIEVSPRLAPLFERSFPTATVCARTDRADQTLGKRNISAQTSMCELVRLFRPSLDRFPDATPYLRHDLEQATAYRESYRTSAPSDKLIGVSWFSGRKDKGWLKSIRLESLHPILTQPGVTFVSLQYGDHVEEINLANQMMSKEMISDSTVDPLKDMEAFAAQVAAMDLVITTSNTTAHMAGALGLPTWVMVPRAGTGVLPWYWFSTGDESPWYKEARLYRQTRWHDWTDVIENVARDLQEFVKS